MIVDVSTDLPVVRGLPPYEGHEPIWNMAEHWRKDYVAVKFAVSKALQPRRICEIGVYSGIAALCFLEACPGAEYLGIDNLTSEQGRGMPIVSSTREKLASFGYRSTILVADSQQMSALPGVFDLIHVDADHSVEGAKHDVALAWNALSPMGHILIDNGSSPSVCAGAFSAMYDLLGDKLFEWEYYGQGVGSILISKES